MSSFDHARVQLYLQAVKNHWKSFVWKPFPLTQTFPHPHISTGLELIMVKNSRGEFEHSWV